MDPIGPEQLLLWQLVITLRLAPLSLSSAKPRDSNWPEVTPVESDTQLVLKPQSLAPRKLGASILLTLDYIQQAEAGAVNAPAWDTSAEKTRASGMGQIKGRVRQTKKR